MSTEDKYKAEANASITRVEIAGYTIEILMYAVCAIVSGVVVAWALLGFGFVLLLTPLLICGIEYGRRKYFCGKAGG